MEPGIVHARRCGVEIAGASGCTALAVDLVFGSKAAFGAGAVAVVGVSAYVVIARRWKVDDIVAAQGP